MNRLLVIVALGMLLVAAVICVGMHTPAPRGVAEVCRVRVDLAATAQHAQTLAVSKALDAPTASGELKTLADTLRLQAARLGAACR